MSRALHVPLIAFVCLIGCNKAKDGEASPTAAKAADSLCSAEHTKVEALGFCVKVEKAWERQPDTKRDNGDTVVSWFRAGEGGVFEVISRDGDLPADAEEMIGKNPTFPAEKGDLYAGKGKWVYRLQNGSGVTQVIVKTSKGVASCGGSSDEKSTRALLERCKTLAPI